MELLQITTRLEYSDQLNNLKQNCVLLFFDTLTAVIQTVRMYKYNIYRFYI